MTNIFSLPNTFDALQLKALPFRELQGMTETLAERRVGHQSHTTNDGSCQDGLPPQKDFPQTTTETAGT